MSLGTARISRLFKALMRDANRPASLGFLGIEGYTLISPDAGRVKVRIIRTDEELMIARSVTRVLNLGSIPET